MEIINCGRLMGGAANSKLDIIIDSKHMNSIELYSIEDIETRSIKV